MSAPEKHLHAASPSPPAGDDLPGDLGEVGLVLTILLIGLVPLVGVVAGVGSWDELSVGLGTLGVVFAGWQLWEQVVARREPRA
jgi:hypothetical protein